MVTERQVNQKRLITNKPFVVTENQWFIRMLRAAGYTERIPKETQSRPN
jgi:hypothetical protein